MRRPPNPVLASELKRLREERQLSQEEVAFHADLTASALSRIERGLNSPSWSTVEAIARALGVRVADIARAVERL